MTTQTEFQQKLCCLNGSFEPEKQTFCNLMKQIYHPLEFRFTSDQTVDQKFHDLATPLRHRCRSISTVWVLLLVPSNPCCHFLASIQSCGLIPISCKGRQQSNDGYFQIPDAISLDLCWRAEETGTENWTCVGGKLQMDRLMATLLYTYLPQTKLKRSCMYLHNSLNWIWPCVKLVCRKKYFSLPETGRATFSSMFRRTGKCTIDGIFCCILVQPRHVRLCIDFLWGDHSNPSDDNDD